MEACKTVQAERFLNRTPQQGNKMQTRFQDMPPEILLIIFGYLSPRTLLLSVAPVCKTFCDVTHCPALWSSIRYNYQRETVLAFSSFLQEQTCVRKLELVLKGLVERKVRCPDLDILMPSSVRKLIVTASHMLQLTHFENEFPNLRVLKLVNLYFDERDDEEKNVFGTPMMAVLSKLTELEKLTFERPSGFLKWYFLGTTGDRLKELIIRGTSLDYRNLHVIRTVCPCLEKFHFETPCLVSDAVHMLRNLPLKDLAVFHLDPFFHNLNFDPDYAEGGYLIFFKMMPSLVCCEFNAANDFNDTVLEYMTACCVNLRVVKFSHLLNVNYKGILKLVTKLEHLTELWVYNCPLSAPWKLKHDCLAKGVKFSSVKWRKKKGRK